MILYGVLRRFEPLHCVARRALAPICPLRELPAVYILVAIGALLEGNDFFKVSGGVTLHAPDCLMLSLEGVFGLGVIELFLDVLQRDPLPAIGVVAGLTGLLSEAALVRIGMAVTALAER